MGEEQRELNRRRFLKTSLQAAAGAAALGSGILRAAVPKDKTITLPGTLPSRKFGKTGHVLPILGHGGSAMVSPFIEDKAAPLIPYEERVRMVRRGYEMGIRYFDTARVYRESEAIMGEALEDVRDDVYLATKILTRDTSPDGIRKTVQTSLEQLRTNYVDCMQLHTPRDYDAAMKVRDELETFHEQGVIRFFGVTTHMYFETIYKLITTGAFEQVLLAYGYFRKGRNHMLSNRNIEWRDLAMAKATALNMGVVAMKVLGAKVYSHNAKNVVPGSAPEVLEKLPGAAIRWVLQDERIHVLNIGISIPSDLEKDVAILKGDLGYTNDDARLLAEFSGKAYESEMVKAWEIV